MQLTTPRRQRSRDDVSVSTIVQLLEANHARIALIVCEVSGSNTARFGEDNGLLSTRGIIVGQDGPVILKGEACPTGEIWAIQDAGATVISITEIEG